uniref:Putative secreted protein n=1 Tax=Anopheles marajoara TaxID=58244 RepID=A0A2M4C7E3_9DIPT
MRRAVGWIWMLLAALKPAPVVLATDHLHGLEFFDIETNDPFRYPAVTNGTSEILGPDDGPRTVLHDPKCSCAAVSCLCCTGVRLERFNFSQKGMLHRYQFGARTPFSKVSEQFVPPLATSRMISPLIWRSR